MVVCYAGVDGVQDMDSLKKKKKSCAPEGIATPCECAADPGLTQRGKRRTCDAVDADLGKQPEDPFAAPSLC